MSAKVHIEIDRISGFCFGVVKAISKAEESLTDAEEVYSLGDIVHNRLEVQRLSRRGLRSVEHSELSSLSGRKLLIRAHGEPPSTYETAKQMGFSIIDATCPVVAQLQRVVAAAWEKMKESDGQVVIFGKRGHAEVVGLNGHADGHAIVVENIGDLDLVDFTRPIFFLSQTTKSLEQFREIRDEILARTKNPDTVTVKDTICRQVSSREGHLREFASRFDVVIFVAGRKSSNGRVLFGVCREANPRSYHIEEDTEIDSGWFSGIRSVGICGATSTPQWLMEQVAEKVRAITDNITA